MQVAKEKDRLTKEGGAQITASIATTLETPALAAVDSTSPLTHGAGIPASTTGDGASMSAPAGPLALSGKLSLSANLVCVESSPRLSQAR